jgi:hypothetical protein
MSESAVILPLGNCFETALKGTGFSPYIRALKSAGLQPPRDAFGVMYG